ncbi:uncharacterized protein L969DRAFT_19916 [Mixia osmundae IAM 14324]|uniref:PIN domain-containing protein n=1 Tax=Mixia osmundae (strain CBS 9802 / IAM 14324 / JCM 22182 / KY 12970) TaxID=764103 RepID=G7E2I6_MIXOS|nr:uncharacterized protein L969DRAFT_19916 [Mixia osmundae IAM 14324]KEI36918.1 hypothetical protein L969DRAFT_19916 [Mixia osmundae IAM 14324]GAA97046.1 hypothetical protein E5Q_03721 [Mixia osmundae IAM 14324]
MQAEVAHSHVQYALWQGHGDDDDDDVEMQDDTVEYPSLQLAQHMHAHRSPSPATPQSAHARAMQRTQDWGKLVIVLDTNILIDSLDLVARTVVSYSRPAQTSLASSAATASPTLFAPHPVTFIVPSIVVNELDGLSKGCQSTRTGDHANTVALAAREATTWLASVTRELTQSTGLLQIQSKGDVPPRSALHTTPDDVILDCALHCRAQRPDLPVLLMTNDENLALKAQTESIRVLKTNGRARVRSPEGLVASAELLARSSTNTISPEHSPSLSNNISQLSASDAVSLIMNQISDFIAHKLAWPVSYHISHSSDFDASDLAYTLGNRGRNGARTLTMHDWHDWDCLRVLELIVRYWFLTFEAVLAAPSQKTSNTPESTRSRWATPRRSGATRARADQIKDRLERVRRQMEAWMVGSADPFNWSQSPWLTFLGDVAVLLDADWLNEPAEERDRPISMDDDVGTWPGRHAGQAMLEEWKSIIRAKIAA